MSHSKRLQRNSSFNERKLTSASILLMNRENVAFRRWRSDIHLLSSFSIASFTCAHKAPEFTSTSLRLPHNNARWADIQGHLAMDCLIKTTSAMGSALSRGSRGVPC